MGSYRVYVESISVSLSGGILADEPPPPVALARANFELRSEGRPPKPISKPKMLNAQEALDMTVRELIEEMRKSS